MNEQHRATARALLAGARHAHPTRASQLFHTRHRLDDVPDQPPGSPKQAANAANVFTAGA